MLCKFIIDKSNTALRRGTSDINQTTEYYYSCKEKKAYFTLLSLSYAFST